MLCYTTRRVGCLRANTLNRFSAILLSSPRVRSISTQIVKSTLIERVPTKLQPYLYLARVDKPVGSLLLFYPCAWSITMAAYALQAPLAVPATYLALFGTGAFIMRGAGCTINDLWDRNLDKGVELDLVQSPAAC